MDDEERVFIMHDLFGFQTVDDNDWNEGEMRKCLTILRRPGTKIWR